MSDDLVLYEKVGHVAEVTLNRPAKLNALTIAMSQELRRVLVDLDRDPEIRVGILGSAGRAFCTGTDVRERQTGAGREHVAGMDGGYSSADFLEKFEHWKPVIAAVHGHAIGGGLSLALTCDLIIAAESATFQVTETARGLSSVALWAALKERTGESFASDVALTGRFWGAEEALRWHMVNEVVPDEELMDRARALAETIAGHPPLSIQETVRRRRFDMQKLRLDVQSSTLRNLRASADFTESAKAFAEKRAAGPFTGH